MSHINSAIDYITLTKLTYWTVVSRIVDFNVEDGDGRDDMFVNTDGTRWISCEGKLLQPVGPLSQGAQVAVGIWGDELSFIERNGGGEWDYDKVYRFKVCHFAPQLKRISV